MSKQGVFVPGEGITFCSSDETAKACLQAKDPDGTKGAKLCDDKTCDVCGGEIDAGGWCPNRCLDI